MTTSNGGNRRVMIAVLAAIALVAIPTTDAEANSTPTYTKDIAPIFASRCVTCHRPGEVAPMSLMTYETARPWAKSIKKAVVGKVMPPWGVNPAHGTFKNDIALSEDEIATIAGALMLVLPQAEQSFDPGGAWWGFVLLLESAAFVTTAFLLRIRWLAICGVLTASGVGIRWLAESGDTIPYWATLGLGGMLLIGAGTSLLLNREWWDRTARQTVDWWEHSPLRA